MELSNAIAPEHLEIVVDRAFDYLGQIRNAGALFLGKYTPPAVADYVAGPNHVLPTNGSARFFSALSVNDFVKRTNIVAYDREGLQAVKPYVRPTRGPWKVEPYEHFQRLSLGFRGTGHKRDFHSSGVAT